MNRWLRFVILAGAITLHLVALLTVQITTQARQEREDTSVFKLVDVQEYIPPAPEPEEPEPEPEEPPPKEVPVVANEPAETIIESEEPIPQSAPPPPQPAVRDIVYLPQHRISKAPGVPTDLIRSRVVYPPLANRQGIEGRVYLELFIDAEGVIRRIEVLQEPGYGLADAAIAAFAGINVSPAEANGIPVAVRYRYPVVFVLR